MKLIYIDRTNTPKLEVGLAPHLWPYYIDWLKDLWEYMHDQMDTLGFENCWDTFKKDLNEPVKKDQMNDHEKRCHGFVGEWRDNLFLDTDTYFPSLNLEYVKYLSQEFWHWTAFEIVMPPVPSKRTDWQLSGKSGSVSVSPKGIKTPMEPDYNIEESEDDEDLTQYTTSNTTTTTTSSKKRKLDESSAKPPAKKVKYNKHKSRMKCLIYHNSYVN